MKRKHKIYSKPRRPYDKARIEEEAKIIKEYGLKNKREIWRADAKIKNIREKAKRMVTTDDKKRKELFDKLGKIGLNVSTIADVLSLDKKDYLNRRLQTVVYKKNMVPTIKTARQMIVHKKVLVNGKIVNVPSYIVPVELEDKITLKLSKKKMEPKAEEKELLEEIKNAKETPEEETGEAKE